MHAFPHGIFLYVDTVPRNAIWHLAIVDGPRTDRKV